MSESIRSPFLSKRNLLFFAVVLVVMLAGPSSVRATLIVNDTWQDGNDTQPAAPIYSEYGNDSEPDGDIESAWFQGGVGTLDPVGPGGPERGNMTAGGTSSATWTTYFTPEGGEMNLLNAGDQLKVTWVFTPSTVNSSNTSQNFRIALIDSPGASRISANGTPGSAAYTGYAIFANMGQTLNQSNPFQLRERVVASGDTLSTSGNWGANGVANVGLANGATNGNTGYANNTQYTFIMTLTRTVLGELQVDATMSGGSLDNDGSASLSIVDTSPNGFKYDMFQIRPSGATTTAELFDTSLFRVEMTVPEPASIALIGMASVALGLRRHRGR